jgi:flagellar M-ring protein FliF
MAEQTLPGPSGAGTSLLGPLTNPAGGGIGARLKGFTAQPAVRKTLPALFGVSALAGVAMLYMMLATGPSRVLYSELSDSERASVVDALTKGGIDYTIDPGTGVLSVPESDLYRARMLVASDGALAAPETSSEMLDSMPMGASRTLEGERLKSMRERDLVQSIMEIDGVESVRVHLAQPEKSVFVRDDLPPTASVMLRLAKGRQISDAQVQAIVNLVAGSVPGLSAEAVRVVDQQGRFLSAKNGATPASDLFELQGQFEDKLSTQLAALLTPMLGEGNFSTQIQVELEAEEQTSARETYGKDGAVRTEAQSESRTEALPAAMGVPGTVSNTPPAPTVVENAPPQGTGIVGPAAGPSMGETTAQRTFELNREVAVSSTTPGSVRRITVAVAVSAEALKKLKPATEAQLQKLVSSAVGADPRRGDEVTVVASTFEVPVVEEVPFYETQWFAMVLRNGVALLAVLLALLFGVRPILKAMRGKDQDAAAAEQGDEDREEDPDGDRPIITLTGTRVVSPEVLREQVGLAQQLANEQPDRAVAALRKMLAAPAQPARGEA